MSYADEEGGSSYAVSPSPDPGTMPRPVQEQQQRNQINENRQARADSLVTSFKDGLKLAALNANEEAMPYTQALAREMVKASARDPREITGNLRRFMDLG